MQIGEITLNFNNIHHIIWKEACHKHIFREISYYVIYVCHVKDKSLSIWITSYTSHEHQQPNIFVPLTLRQ